MLSKKTTLKCRTGIVECRNVGVILFVILLVTLAFSKLTFIETLQVMSQRNV